MLCLSARSLCAALGLSLAFLGGCDGDPVPVIVEGEGEGGEGEGEGGEGEGEGEIIEGDCPALKNAVFGEAIDLVVARSRHTAALLSDGRVMLIGGEDDNFLQIADVEIIDVETGVSVAGPSLNVARYEHASVVLSNGTVVVAGGFGTGGHLASIESFDGVEWKVAGDLDAARAGITGVNAFDKAVFFGGDNAESIPTTVVTVDPDLNITVLPVNIGANRRQHAAAVNSDGDVVVVGGFFTSEVDTVTSFSSTLARQEPRIPGARLLAGAGTVAAGVVVVGGRGGGEFLNDIQVLNNGAWTLTSRLRVPRGAPEVADFKGCLAVCGGIGGDPAESDAVKSCEGVDAEGRNVSMVDLPVATFSFTLTPLPTGGALFAGGTLDDGHVAEARVLR